MHNILLTNYAELLFTILSLKKHDREALVSKLILDLSIWFATLAWSSLNIIEK